MRPSAHRQSCERAARRDPATPATLQPPTEHACTRRLATPASRMLLALLFAVAIWLPSVLLTHGMDPVMVVVNAALTSVSLLVFSSRRARAPNRSTRQDSPPRG